MIISSVQGVQFWYDKYKMAQNTRKAICIPENKTFTLDMLSSNKTSQHEAKKSATLSEIEKT